MHREDARITGEPATSSQTKNITDLESPREKRESPISPLTTIPVYMSGSPSEADGESSEQQESSSLSQFLQALGSDETQSSFKCSNPQAARQGAVFGIVLVNTGELPLGQLIHKIAKGLSRFLHNQRSPLPANGRIFFLDAVILGENIDPENPEFCLQQTWRNLGVKYYYACLRWSFVKRVDQAHVGPEFQHVHQDGNYESVSDGPSPALFVSFDEDDILALGEYTSMDGLADPTTL
jgi:DNA ligase-4